MKGKSIAGAAALALLALVLVAGQVNVVVVVLIIAMSLLAWKLWPASEQKPKSSRFAAGFQPECEHDNIAIDTKSDQAWLRDAKRGERYVTRAQIKSFKPTWMQGNGVYRHRLEISLDDIKEPLWEVPFDRHGDRWKSAGLRNRAGLDEWCARLGVWINSEPFDYGDADG